MFIGPISSLVSSFLQPSTSNPNTSNAQASSLSWPQDSPAQISPVATFLNQLQQLQQNNPARFQQVVTGIGNKLTQAANAAQTSGHTTLANQLNQLASQFQNAASTGQLPSAQALQQAGLGGHHHHGHHGGGQSAQNTQSTLASAFQTPSSDAQTILSGALQSSI